MAEKTILIVDDSITMRKILKHHLTQIGYSNIKEAPNGAEGLKKLEEEEINLIICDWNMPEMNGLQFLHTVRAIDNYQNIPIVMVTTVNTQDEVMAALKAGASSYITKPFSKEDLKTKINQLLNE
ncbi:response regulator [Candidatus Aerophobetes bacterium]|nr:response regulator [Candidatus Aerophobetes bacterium]